MLMKQKWLILGYVDRTNPEEVLNYEIDFPVTKGKMEDIVARTYNILGTTETGKMLDKVKAIGYKHTTLGAVTINVFDMTIPEEKYNIINETKEISQKNEQLYGLGLITREEKINKNVELWNAATAKIKKCVVENFDAFNPLKMIVTSKARGNDDQVNQLCGVRGIIANSSGQKVDIPVLTCFREGLKPIDYFMSTRGGRKGLADTALKTADAGYLSRRLVDIAHGVVVTEEDCFESLGEKPKGMVVTEIRQGDQVIETLKERISGRVAVEDIKHPQTDAVIVKGGEMITPEMAQVIVDAGITAVNIRTVLTCKSKRGVCAKCYGRDMVSTGLVEVGDAVGIVAAQSIGEPGTQLTMRTFHTGGVASVADMTQGLPRVEEIFEARRPNDVAVMSEVAGRVTVRDVDKRKEVIVKTKDGDVSYLLPARSFIKVKDGDEIESGTPLTEGSLYPQDILRTRGLKDVQEYMLTELLSVYKSQGVPLEQKHFEIIIRQMLRKVKIESSGDTEFIPGDTVDIFDYEQANLETVMQGKQPATAKRILLGVTKSSLATTSFLSAASFQESSRVLTEASMKGKVDHLVGLKENVIIGKLIPAGTGLPMYKNTHINTEENEEEQANQTSNVALSLINGLR